MSHKPFIYAANWKMQLSFSQAISYAEKNSHAFAELTTHGTIIVFPSFDALYPITQQFEQTHVATGAQNCSAYASGAYTGQVQAQSLNDIGCSYCIIGHSEQRTACQKRNQVIAEQAEQLIQVGIIPIICIGETKEQRDNKQTKEILTKQLAPLNEIKKSHNIIIAYEPIWAIGTGTIPESRELTETISWITEQNNMPVLYGGSVNEENASTLKAIPEVAGFLIGGASLDFQKFKKIVLS